MQFWPRQGLECGNRYSTLPGGTSRSIGLHLGEYLASTNSVSASRRGPMDGFPPRFRGSFRPRKDWPGRSCRQPCTYRCLRSRASPQPQLAGLPKFRAAFGGRNHRFRLPLRLRRTVRGPPGRLRRSLCERIPLRLATDGSRDLPFSLPSQTAVVVPAPAYSDNRQPTADNGQQAVVELSSSPVVGMRAIYLVPHFTELWL
jgi:hypothetical protein